MNYVPAKRIIPAVCAICLDVFSTYALAMEHVEGQPQHDTTERGNVRNNDTNKGHMGLLEEVCEEKRRVTPSNVVQFMNPLTTELII